MTGGQSETSDQASDVEMDIPRMSELVTQTTPHPLDHIIVNLRLDLEKNLDSHRRQCILLDNLATNLLSRYNDQHENWDLDEAILLRRRIVNITPKAVVFSRESLPLQSDGQKDCATSLASLAEALVTQFSHGGGLNHLEEAIEFHRQALLLRPHPHPNRFYSLLNLANALRTQFNHGGGLNHLEETIELNRQALQLMPHPHPNRSSSLVNLANAFLTQFRHGGGLNHLEEAIELYRQALQHMPHSHPNRVYPLLNLANALQTQFIHGGGLNYLDEAVELHRQALQLRPYPHPKHFYSLHNLANALVTQFNHGGGLNHLEEAIELHRRALQLLPYPHPYRSGSLASLANTLVAQFKHSGGLNHLEGAIEMYRQALQLRPHPHPRHSDTLAGLATALAIHVRHSSRLNYLWEAIFLMEQELTLSSVHNTPTLIIQISPHILQSQQSQYNLLCSLARLYVDAHHMFQKSQDYLTKAMHAFHLAQCIPSISPFQQFKAAEMWAKCASRYHHPSAMEAYHLSMQSLPKITSLSHSLNQRQADIVTHTNIQTTARDAFHYAISMRCFDKAVEFLETARAVLWSQILQLRSSFSQLIAVYPQLGQRLQDIAMQLDQPSHFNTQNASNYITSDRQPSQLSNLTTEWQSKLVEARKIPGFEHFLHPSPFSLLQQAAVACPIVILVPHVSGSHCLILTSVTTHYFDQPTLPMAKLRDLGSLTQGVASNDQSVLREGTIIDILPLHPKLDMAESDTVLGRTVSNRDIGPAKPRFKSLDDMLKYVLEVLWRQVVKPVIEILKIEKSTPSRKTIQWCPASVFTFLPLHAAGIYTPVAPTKSPSASSSVNVIAECASDYIISSYTPTIGALLFPDHASPAEEFNMLTVAVDAELYYPRQEIMKIKNRIPMGCLTEIGLDGVPARVDTVLSHLTKASIVHFACHGVQDQSNSFNSGLVMQDGRLTISKIMAQPHPNGSLAFLCACETAMGDKKLPDEAMSVGASLMFSGFKSVVATMWRIKDIHGPIIADAFYEELFRGPDGNPMSVPNFDRTAQSLDIAVQKLRKSGVPLRKWVPFIHMGKAT